ncbi:MAG: ROK family protein [Gammaproteobacteria bacterium]
MKIVSGPTMTPASMLAGLHKALRGWRYDVVSIGFPAPVVRGRIVSQPVNLGAGWIGFDFEAAFGCAVRLANDAAMQALGSYAGGHMLFLGLGTGLGSAVIVDGEVQAMELAHMPYRKKTYEYYVSEAALKRLGKQHWSANVFAEIEMLRAALEPDYVILGGGNLRLLKQLPRGVRRGNNANAFIGGFRLWENET